MIIDCHVHILPGPGERLAEAVAHMLGCMDRLGLDQACLSLGNRLIVQPTAAEVRESNAWVLNLRLDLVRVGRNLRVR